MPKISIIVPCYNTEKYVRRCLDALVVQTLSDIEILCIDDGSTDDTYALLKEYAQKDKRLRVFHQENDKGPGQARNVGLKNASAPYIMFCDSDDWYEPNMCEVMYQTIVKQKTDVVQCQTFFDMEEGYEQASTDKRLNKNFFNLGKKGKYRLNNQEIRSTNELLWQKIFKADTIQKSELFFERHIGFDDTIFWLCFACFAKDIYYIQEKLYHYFVRTGSIMDDSLRMSTQAFSDKTCMVLKSVLCYLTKKDLQKKYRAFIHKKVSIFLESNLGCSSKNVCDLVSLFTQIYGEKYCSFDNCIYKRVSLLRYILETIRLHITLLWAKGRSKEKRIEKLRKLEFIWKIQNQQS